MVRTDRPLDNPINWSFHAARVFGINIRVHVAFVLCAVVLIWMELPKDGAPTQTSFMRVLADSLGLYVILFAIVLLHEFGHCFGARYMGGDADEILLWPLGGLAFTNPPHDARSHMITTIAGPLVNVGICTLCAAALVVWTGTLGAVPLNPLHPTLPVNESILLTATEPQLWVIRGFGLSYFLLLINLLPIFPFDGGRIVQAWLWPRKGYRSSMAVATSTGMISAIVVGLFGLFTSQDWLLLMIAVFGYFTCWQTRRMLMEGGSEVGELGYDFSRGYGAFDSHEHKRPRRAGFLERRRARKQASRDERARKMREAHERAVELVLRRISESGIDSLTPRERRVLEEETRRRQTERDSNR